MDFLALYITARLLHAVIKPLRISVAAVIGAVYALVAVLLDSTNAALPFRILSFSLGILCVYLMTSITVSHVPKEAVKAGVTYVAVNIGLGGTITAIGSMLTRLTQWQEVPGLSVSPVTSPVTFIIVAAISGGVSLIYGKLHARAALKRKTKAELTVFGASCEVTLLCDSGNLLREPIAGKPVIIVGSAKLKNKLPEMLLHAVEAPMEYAELPYELARRIRLIPASSVVGSGLLLGFIPDSITVDGRQLDAVVAVDAINNSFGECDGIIPQILLSV